MSLKPSTPERQRAMGRQIGRERAEIDIHKGVRQDPEHLWCSATASPAFREGLATGYRERMNPNAPRSLED